MSLHKSTTRLHLLAGSSFVAAIAAGSLLAAPTAARAAPNPCGEDPAADGAVADVIICPVATYPTGIQHTSSGDLSVTVQTGTSPTLSNFGTGGVVSTGVGADDLTLRLTGSGTASIYSYNAQAFPALLNAQSQTGDVLVELEVVRTNSSAAPAITANNAATTAAVRAVSTAGGDVVVRNLSRGTSGVFNGFIQALGSPSSTGIVAQSVGGGDVTVDLGVGQSRGRLYGILAQADGAGNITVTGQGVADGAVANSMGLRAVTGAGTVTVNSASAFTGRTGASVVTDGDVTFTASAQGTDYGAHFDVGGDVTFTGNASGGQYGIYLVDVASGTTSTLNLTGNPTTGGVAAIRAQGAGDVILNIQGRQTLLNFDFTGMADKVSATFVNGGVWQPTADNLNTVGLNEGDAIVPAGNFSVTIEDTGVLVAGTQFGGNNIVEGRNEGATILSFADPAFVLQNNGFIVVGPQGNAINNKMHEAELRLVGLSEFRHAGRLLLGGGGFSTGVGPSLIGGVDISRTDGWRDDLFVLEDSPWIGEGGVIVMDADLTLSQADCTRRTEDALDPASGDFAAADCVRIVNGSTEGVTYVAVTDRLVGDRGRLNADGIVLVETPGTTSAQGHFVIAPETFGYSDAFGGIIDKGLFQYTIVYDEAREQHILYGFVGGSAYQFPVLATAAQSLWRTSTGTWLERQADLRGDLREGIGGGVWLRGSAEQADRDVTNTSVGGGLDFSFDNTHEQKSYAVTGGIDLMNGADGETAYVVGIMAGYAHAELEYDASPNQQAMDGWTAGAYASFLSGGLFVDAALNANNVILDNDTPGLNFFPTGTILSSRLISVGGQVEAGWRMPFDGGLFIEPLAALSYVRSSYDDVVIRPDDPNRPGVTATFDDPTSLRAGLGGRVGVDQDFGVVRAQFSLLGRVWNEFEGENAVIFHNDAFPNDPDILLIDDGSGQFNELALGTSLYSAGGTISGFLNVGGKFGDDYEATTGSVGVRIAW